jgi:hypothetical protein
MGITRDAVISVDGLYRYLLTRIWDSQLPLLHACGANPSKADAMVDDLTVTKLMGFGARWGYGGLMLCNINAYRATDPEELNDIKDPIGSENLNALKALAGQGQPVLCFWGDLGMDGGRGRETEELFRSQGAKLLCLGLTRLDNPRHCSRLGYQTPLYEWRGLGQLAQPQTRKQERR